MINNNEQSEESDRGQGCAIFSSKHEKLFLELPSPCKNNGNRN